MSAARRYFVVGLIVAGFATLSFCADVFLSNVRLLERRYPMLPAKIDAAATPEPVQRGKALADITGCTDGHGADLRGRRFDDERWRHGRCCASNRTQKAQTDSDEDLARIVRLGVRPDGRGVVAMPAFGFVRLTDDEMADIIAFLRSVPAGGSIQPEHFIGPLDQWDLGPGRTLKAAVTYVADERCEEPRMPDRSAARHAICWASSVPNVMAAT